LTARLLTARWTADWLRPICFAAAYTVRLSRSTNSTASMVRDFVMSFDQMDTEFAGHSSGLEVKAEADKVPALSQATRCLTAGS